VSYQSWIIRRANIEVARAIGLLLCLVTPMQAAGPTAHMPHCLVSLVHDVDIPALEGGVLTKVITHQGDYVQLGEALVQIDDRRSRHARDAAEIELRAAREQANDSADVEYAKAAHQVAWAELDQSRRVNARVAGTIPYAEIRRLQLTENRAKMQIVKSQLSLRVAKMSAEVNTAKLHVADDQLKRMRIVSPTQGRVATIYHQAGEWVQPGEPVVRVVGMDRLRVEGFLHVDHYNPDEIADCDVRVTVTLARGEQLELPGKIVHVSSLVQAGGKYRVRAEVVNQKRRGHWLLRAGMIAQMDIQLRSQ
jgi:multidrug efflux pump subunit AcrA (membrane-fusion protein)